MKMSHCAFAIYPLKPLVYLYFVLFVLFAIQSVNVKGTYLTRLKRESNTFDDLWNCIEENCVDQTLYPACNENSDCDGILIINDVISCNCSFDPDNENNLDLPAVTNIMCNPYNHMLVSLSWDLPANNVDYLVFASLESTITYFLITNRTSVNIEPPDATTSLSYQVQYKMGSNYSVLSTSVSCQPLSLPNDLIIVLTTSETVTVTWMAYPNGQVSKIIIMWAQISDKVWRSSLPLPGSATEDTITDLKPGTGYIIKARIMYAFNDIVEDTQDTSLRTNDGVPNSPREVEVVGQSPNGFLVWVEPFQQGNLPIILYVIEAREVSDPLSPISIRQNWVIVDNITANVDKIWAIDGLTAQRFYQFRIYATNFVGRGDSSAPTSIYQVTYPIDDSRHFWMIVGSSVGGVALIIIIGGVLLWCCCRKRRRLKKLRKNLPVFPTTIHLDYGMDVELANIRNMTNLALAAVNNDSILPLDYRERIPLFPRDQLKLDTLLGEGAFGEVYKGVAIDIKEEDCGVETAVAVKTLKPGATDGEKCEFLMEAYFMSLFEHPNIISLLGVCLNNQYQFLILELMEGGDLLKYLRQARSTALLKAKLNITDLLDICLDLAAGCQYLESQKFIHRDLAARNCLVSTQSYKDNTRIVKLGDFGLARDIYKSEYYLKEGEGLLPVRWMAPESLGMKLYTVHSDVWSFGVLMWEVMTFGEQPYQAFSNVDVIQYVKNGGRLDQPLGCPDSIYRLMQRCWNIENVERPSFHELLEELQKYKSVNTKELTPKTASTNYAVVSPDDSVFETNSNGYDNQGYNNTENLEEEHNVSLSTPYINNNTALELSTDAAQAAQLNYAKLGFPPSRDTSIKQEGGKNENHYVDPKTNSAPLHFSIYKPLEENETESNIWNSTYLPGSNPQNSTTTYV